MKLMIRLSDFDEKPCNRYFNYIQKYHPNDQEFDAIELINKISYCKHDDIQWLIARCNFAQTIEVFKYYKSLNPHYSNVRRLIVLCEFSQTIEMLEYYKSLRPHYRNVRMLIEDCKFAQTIEMVEYYKSLSPDYEDVRWLIKNCDFAKDNWDSVGAI